jgi:hypothetical protein
MLLPNKLSEVCLYIICYDDVVVVVVVVYTKQKTTIVLCSRECCMFPEM